MILKPFEDKDFMKEALKEAQKAIDKDEVPVGCVVVCENKIIARAYNLTQTLNDVTAHAEIQAITSAANYLGGKYLDECKLYVTLEPCVMCAGALRWAQLGELVYGAEDKKQGYTIVNKNILHKKTKVKKMVLSKECSILLTKFFKIKRQ